MLDSNLIKYLQAKKVCGILTKTLDYGPRMVSKIIAVAFMLVNLRSMNIDDDSSSTDSDSSLDMSSSDGSSSDSSDSSDDGISFRDQLIANFPNV